MELPFFWDKQSKLADLFVPEDEETRLFIESIYSDLADDANIRRQPEMILGGGSIEDVWSRSIEDYTLFTPTQSRDDIVKPYVSAIGREKTNTFVSTVFGQSARPSVVAQNRDQEIDIIISRVLKTLLDHAFKTDGMPSLNGRQKRMDTLLVGAIEGTVFVQEEYVDGTCVRSIVPNEQIYVPNPWQADLQKQAHVIRCIGDVTYNEARLAYGHLENFDFVKPGGYENWTNGDWTFWKNYRSVLSIGEGLVQILHVWYPVPGSKKKEKFYNLIINGIPMYPWDNKMPFKHGFYPLSVFCPEKAHPQYFWGISIPWKVRHDKSYQDSMKTVIRYKHKAGAFKSYLTSNPDLTDEKIFSPATISLVNGKDLDKALVQVPGISDGVNASDINLLQLSERESDAATSAPILSGQEPGGNPTAREISAIVSYAQKNQSVYSDRFTTSEISLDWMRLSNIIQFYPGKKINGLCKISVPNAQLLSGRTGTMEVMLEKIPPMTKEEEIDVSMRIRGRQNASAEEKNPVETIIIDPSYLRNLDWYVMVEDQGQTDMEIARELDFAARAEKNPYANQEEVWRDVLRAFGKDEDRHVKKQQPAPPQGAPGQQAPPGGGQPPAETNLPNIKELAKTAI